MTHRLFFYGTLCHIPLLEVVLGRSRAQIDISSAQLRDHAVSWVAGEAFPMIEPCEGSLAQGVLVRDLSADDIARLTFYEGGFSYDLQQLDVQAGAQRETAEVFFPQAGRWQAGLPWVLADWEREWAAVSLSAAREVMALYGSKSAEEIAHLLPFLRARGWASEVLAQEGAPATLRSGTARSEVAFSPRPDGYRGFFCYDTFQLAYPRFDGTTSAPIERGAFVAYDAALVLPYDPARDELLLIEQLRYGPLLRGDPMPWVLEPIAGLVDAGEPPMETARREAMEEAGLTLSDIRPMLKTYASPGYSTEFFHCFLAICDLSEIRPGVHGLQSENEDIRTHILPFSDAMALVETGEVNCGPLAMMLLWLASKRGELRNT